MTLAYTMDFELYPTITLRSGSFNALLAPRDFFIQAVNRYMNLQRFSVLYVTDNYFDEGPRAEMKIAAKAKPRAQRSQTTFEAFSYVAIAKGSFRDTLILRYNLYSKEGR